MKSNDPPVIGPDVHELAMILAASVLEGVHRSGLTEVRPAHLPVLRALNRGPQRIGELTRLTHLARPSLIYLVNELERLELVARTADPGDRRGTLVALTERGQVVPGAARRAVRELQDHWEQTLPLADITRFAATLRTLVTLSAERGEPVRRHLGRRRPDQ